MRYTTDYSTEFPMVTIEEITSEWIEHAREREVEKAIVALGRGRSDHEVFLLLKPVFDTSTVAIPANQPLDHVDEFLPVHLLIVGITRRHIRVDRLEYHCPGRPCDSVEILLSLRSVR
ncbi:hypothetical protein C451_01000 [Halococcus thailandensis JCM 13552]|jgi:hypothetical protein|uniref:Uncharacterized protein n=1 Tax=Halococcus thailandensis JCM 13552 TaxID=1227457 RepID=M0NFT6_9EURY|nr:hypothetical protein C451_01000 [Halococcus thailandensis JCM 13552]